MRTAITALLLLTLTSPAAAQQDAAKAQELRVAMSNGLASLRQRKHADAVGHFSTALKLSPRNWKAYYFRGAAYMGLGKRLQALQDYNRSIAINPNVVELYIARAKLFLSIADLAKARADLNLAIELKPTNAEGYYQRGNTWLAEHALDKAIADYDRALQLAPQAVIVHYRKGLALLDQGKLDAAAAEVAPMRKPLPTIAKLLEEQVSVHRAARMAGADLGKLFSGFEGTKLSYGWLPGSRRKLTSATIKKLCEGLDPELVTSGLAGMVVGVSRAYARGIGNTYVVALIFRDAKSAEAFMPLQKALLARNADKYKQHHLLKHQGYLTPPGPLDLGSGKKEGWRSALKLKLDHQTTLISRSVTFRRGRWVVEISRTASETGKQFDLEALAGALARKLATATEKQ